MGNKAAAEGPALGKGARAFLPEALEGSRSPGGSGRGPLGGDQPPASSCLPRPVWRLDDQKALRRPSSKSPCSAPPVHPGSARAPALASPAQSPPFLELGGPGSLQRESCPFPRPAHGTGTLRGEAQGRMGAPSREPFVEFLESPHRPEARSPPAHDSAALGGWSAGVSVGITPSAPGAQSRAERLGSCFP